MSRRILRTYTLPALLVTGMLLTILIGWSIWRWHEIDQLNSLATGAEVGASGLDFLLEPRATPQPRRPVEASIHLWPSEVTQGDSLSVVLRLDKIKVPECTDPAPTSKPCNLGEEKGGSLVPTLVAAADCQVTPQKARAIDTTQAVSAFVWPWTVDCKSAGVKALQFSLDLQATDKTNGSTPLNFRHLSYFRVSDPLWPSVLGFVTGLAGMISVVSGVLAKIMPHKTEGPAIVATDTVNPESAPR